MPSKLASWVIPLPLAVMVLRMAINDFVISVYAVSYSSRPLPIVSFAFSTKAVFTSAL
ncbi:hypothetical protein D3C75_776080 [compost metagenome]